MAQTLTLPPSHPLGWKDRPSFFNGTSKSVLDLLESYEQAPLCPDDFVTDNVRKYRQRIWDYWLEFIDDINLELSEQPQTSQREKVDAHTIWFQLLVGIPFATSLCQTFLELYVKNSEVWRPVLGPQERVKVRLVNSAVTVEDAWAALVKSADTKVMEPKRRAEPLNSAYWSLSYCIRQSNKCRATAAVGKWIGVLANKIGLLRHQSFEKKEVTSNDLLLIFETLWSRAEHITCTASARLAFHCSALLGGIGGWRPSSTLDIKYEDVQFRWCRDPKDPSVTRVICIITIYHVKTGFNKIDRDQKHRLSFAVTRVPCPLVCLTTLLGVRAIYDNAFDESLQIHSPSQLLAPGTLEPGINEVHLNWKEGMAEKFIVPLKYNRYRTLWHRTVLVTGTRESVRPYAMRVGTGGRLDGVLTPALRNFILANSSGVFEKSYQPANIRVDLLAINFPTMAGDTAYIIQAVHEICNSRDPSAPLYISAEQKTKFEQRRDITQLKQLRTVASAKGDDKEYRKLSSQLNNLRKYLESLQLEEDRRMYFQHADRRRCLQSNNKFQQQIDPQCTSIASSILIEKANSGIGDLLVQYLKEGGSRATPTLGPSPIKHDTEQLLARPQCLICYKTLSRKHHLTSHVRTVHQKQLRAGLHCLLCPNSQMIKGIDAWANHIANNHSRKDVPGVSKTSPCLLCPKNARPLTDTGYLAHFTAKHVKAGQFETPFPCPSCLEDDKRFMIDSQGAWIMHAQFYHQWDILHRLSVPQRKVTKEESTQIVSKVCDDIKGGTEFDNNCGSDFDNLDMEDFDARGELMEEAQCHEGEEFWSVE